MYANVWTRLNRLLDEALDLTAQGGAPGARDAAQRAAALLEKTAGPQHPAAVRARVLAVY